MVTRAATEWAEGVGWMPVTEMPLAFLEDTPDQPGRQGIVDLYVARQGYRTDLVVEIDSGNKRWSAQKLGHAVNHGRAAIWVRWSGSGPPADIVPAGVEVIFLDVTLAPRIRPAEPAEDLRTIPSAGGLSGASRALLAALYPSSPPEEDPGWHDEAAIWDRVAELRPRLALVVRCRFGHYAPRPLTLNRTAEVVADELDVAEVTRERIRQLQIRALRQLRARSAAKVRAARRAAGNPDASSPPSAGRAVDGAPVPANIRPALRAARPPGAMAPVPEPDVLWPMLVAIVRAAGRGGVRASMVGHVLRGSSGPVTRALVARLNLPHDGALPGVPYRPLYEEVVRLANDPPLRLRDGRVSVRP